MYQPSAAYRKAVLAPVRDAPEAADHGLAPASCLVTAVQVTAPQVKAAQAEDSVCAASQVHFDYGGESSNHELRVLLQST